jgi:8-oxo-dGTP pyrophosphatase MutT (NUDIX family)
MRQEERRAARIILLDEANRILLFRGGNPGRQEAGTWWFTPGGGVGKGETVEEAARRELREETGLEVRSLGPVVLQSESEHEFQGGRYLQKEDYFLVRCHHFELSDAGWTPGERRVLETLGWLDAQQLS